MLEDPKPSLVRPVPHDNRHCPPDGARRRLEITAPVLGFTSSRKVAQPLGRLLVQVVTWVHVQMPSTTPQGQVVVQDWL